MKRQGRRDPGHGRKRQVSACVDAHDSSAAPPSLADLGITRDLSSQSQRLAGIADDVFEGALARASPIAGNVAGDISAPLRTSRALPGPPLRALGKPLLLAGRCGSILVIHSATIAPLVLTAV
jgi:hypothetical protein